MSLNPFKGFSLPKITPPKLPKLSLPKLKLPKLSLPKIKLPNIKLPKLPKLKLPSLDGLNNLLNSLWSMTPFGMMQGAMAYIIKIGLVVAVIVIVVVMIIVLAAIFTRHKQHMKYGHQYSQERVARTQFREEGRTARRQSKHQMISKNVETEYGMVGSLGTQAIQTTGQAYGDTLKEVDKIGAILAFFGLI